MVEVAHDNLAGWGRSRSSFSFSLSEGLTQYNLDYTLPISPQGGTVSFGYDNSNSQIIEGEFRDLNIRSESETVSVGVRQPIARSANSEFATGSGSGLAA